PVGFFFEEGPVAKETVLWKERPPSPAAEQIESRLLELGQQYRNLEEWAEEAPRESLVSPQWAVLDGAHRTNVWRLACPVRDFLRLRDTPALSLLPAVEEVQGVKVFHLAFDPEGTAASTVSQDFGPAVLLNSKDRRTRRVFGLAHELFHLITWSTFRANATT